MAVVTEAAAPAMVQPAAEAPAPGLVAVLTAASRASAVAGLASENAAIEQVLFAAHQLKQRAQQVLQDISDEPATAIQAVIDKL